MNQLKSLIIIPILLLSTSCILKGKILVAQTEVENIIPGIIFTSPLIDSVSKSATADFDWNPIITNLRTTNAYEVNVYSQASCAGSATTTTLINTPSYTLTGIKDKFVYSIGVTAYSSKDIPSEEVCSTTVTGDAIISMLQVAGGSYLTLDVDFTKKVAYAGINSGRSFDAIDFNDEENPVLLNSLGSTSTPASAISSSRGVAVYNSGERLIVAGNNSSSIELWNLTTNPRTIGSWTKMGTLTGLSSVRKIVKVDTTDASNTIVTLALRQGLAIVNIAEPTGTMTIVRSRSNYSNGHGAGAIMGNWMISPDSNTGASLDLFNLTTLVSDAQYPFPEQSLAGTPMGTTMWAAATNPSGTKGFSSGKNMGFFSYNLATPGVFPVNTKRVFTSVPSFSRDATYVSEFGKDLFYVGLSAKGIDVWDATDIANPVILHHLDLPNATSEVYGVRVNSTSHRAYAVTTGGQFYIINTEMLAPTILTMTAF
jgi:hypothetical protein